MIELHETVTWTDGHADGVVRDTRQPLPVDGLLPGAVAGMGDHESGPYISLTIEARRYPRTAPVHLHKSDTFRMALGHPIVVGRRSYGHGEFRLQQTDTFYGPELWTDEIGTNQLLVIADRRGAKPYLAAAERQALVDAALLADVEVAGIAMHDRDTPVDHEIKNNFGAEAHAGHWDAGFNDTTSWPALADGTRLAVVALGDSRHGPLLLCWDRAPGGVELPAATIGTDLLRLVVEGSCTVDGRTVERLGFRLQQAGTRHGPSAPGAQGAKELWLLADRTGWPPAWEPARSAEGTRLLSDLSAHVAAVLAG